MLFMMALSVSSHFNWFLPGWILFLLGRSLAAAVPLSAARGFMCVSIYKSANDKIVQTGIKAELEGKKNDFECQSVRHGM